jgi:hypothetical protein
MRPLLALLGSTSLLDEDTADRLLRGRLDPGDAPSGYAQVARVTKAATAPATPEELAGQAAAVAAFRAAAHATPPTVLPRRASMPSRSFRFKAAAAVVVAVLSVGGVAAATGMLSGGSQQAAQHASATSQAGSPARAHSGASTTHGPDATGSAKDGLCQAWQSGQGATNGGRMDATAFQALVAAAGGADQVAAYCQAALAGKGAGHAGAGGGDARATKDGLCKAWQARQAAGHGRWEESAAYKALVKAAGGADKVAAYCQSTTTSGDGHGQAPDQRSSGSSNGHGGGQGGPPTTEPPATG